MTSTAPSDAVDSPDPDSDEGTRTVAGRVGWVLAVAALVVVPAMLMVFRYTADHLQADGVWQSVMSVQDVDLFYWGQDRFFAVLPLLASPIADPAVNLFLLLLINAVAFQALLLTVCHLALDVIADPPDRRALVISYLTMTATAQWVLAPLALYSFALDASPHATAWLLALWSYQLWKRRSTVAMVVAGGLVLVSVGLSPQPALLVGLLVVIDAIRRGGWRRWIAFGGVWVGALVLWTVCARVWGQNPGPIDPPPRGYFSFGRSTFLAGVNPSTTAIVSAFRMPRLILGVLVAACALLAIRPRWIALMPRMALALIFTIGFWVLFTANLWTALNQYNLRYYFPVLLLPVLAIAVPTAAAAAAVRGPAVVRWMPAVVAAGASLTILLAGPLRPPSDATALRQTRAVADFVRDKDILFVSGYYWDMWPTLHQTLADGRDAHFVTAYKSGGEAQAYRDALSRTLEEGRNPTAICVNDDPATCTTYLEYWTQPGWTVTDRTCPVPSIEQVLGGPPVHQCRVLEFTG